MIKNAVREFVELYQYHRFHAWLAEMHYQGHLSAYTRMWIFFRSVALAIFDHPVVVAAILRFWLWATRNSFGLQEAWQAYVEVDKVATRPITRISKRTLTLEEERLAEAAAGCNQ